MKKKQSNLIPILGIVSYGIYLLMYILLQVYNVSTGNYYYQTFFHTTILQLLKIFIIYGLMTAYMAINCSKKDKKKINQIFSIILFIIAIILIISNLRSMISYLGIAIKYIGNKILVGLNLISQGIDVLACIMIAINLFGLMIQKKFPYKVFMIITIALLGMNIIFGLGTSIYTTLLSANIREGITQLFSLITQVFFICFQIFYTLTIYKNGKEIK